MVLELTERGAVGTLRNLAFVEVFKVVACKAVKCSGYRWSGSSVVLVRLVQFLDELTLGFVYVRGRGVYVVAVAPVPYDIAPIFPAAAYLVDVRSAALYSEFCKTANAFSSLPSGTSRMVCSSCSNCSCVMSCPETEGYIASVKRTLHDYYGYK